MMIMKLDTRVGKQLRSLLDQYPIIVRGVERIAQQGGRSFIVGAVRDLLSDIPVKDIDIEVHGLSLEQLEALLKTLGTVSLIGKSFGVLRLHGLDVDWSLPRTDSAGRKPKVEFNPDMEITQAFARRDLTMNAMGIDLVSYELVDPFNGYQDLKNGILRAPDEHLFCEDPLRFFRVMQFIGRFAMQPDDSLNALCARMDISQISTERIEAEFEKLLLKSVRPSLGIRWLRSIGRLAEILPELAATIGCQQEHDWHPEGDVFEHSMQALDAAARVTYDDTTTELILRYAALCHDIGKVTTTRFIDGRLRSWGHDEAGVPLTKTLLSRITRKKEVIASVVKLVKYHMRPGALVIADAGLAAYKRLALSLAPNVSMHLLADLAYADRCGLNGNGPLPLTDPDLEIELFRKKAEEASVTDHPEPPVLMGRDLLDVIKPGRQMGELLAAAYKIQIEEGIKNKEELKRRILPSS